MTTTTEREPSWAHIAGRMQVFAELLIQLDDGRDDLGDAEVRRRVEMYAGLARKALVECDTSGRPA